MLRNPEQPPDRFEQSVGSAFARLISQDLERGVQEFIDDAVDRAFDGIRARRAVHMCYGYSRNVAEKRSTPVYAEALSLLSQTNTRRAVRSGGGHRI